MMKTRGWLCNTWEEFLRDHFYDWPDCSDLQYIAWKCTAYHEKSWRWCEWHVFVFFVIFQWMNG